MLKTSINPANLQAMLDSATNAAAKGQAQYLTPEPWAQALAAALPQYRPVIVDFTAGHGNLLRGSASRSTLRLLGCEIEARQRVSESANQRVGTTNPETPLTNSLTHESLLSIVRADITRFWPMLVAVNWECDLAVLNPPWDLHWDRARLCELTASGCPAVAEAFAAHDGRTGPGEIDSTVATLMMALDRMTPYGEGYILANENTLQRLILGPHAPHAALRKHCWAHAVITGNICDLTDRTDPADPAAFRTGVLWFARTHHDGIADMDTVEITNPQSAIKRARAIFGHPDFRDARRGAKLRPGLADEKTVDLWNAVCQEWHQCNPSANTRPQWNIWLDADGAIQTNLSLFDTASGRIDKQTAARLHELKGRNPMRLVMQRAQRTALERAAFGPKGDGNTLWRVSPAVVVAVKAAVDEYNRARAPLYPLSKIQRLGYVDEHDKLLCIQDLKSPVSNLKCFEAGQWYSLRTETLRVRRKGEKVNEEGGIDNVEFEGSELAIYMNAGEESTEEHLFMDLRFMAKGIELSGASRGSPGKISFTLQQLCDHFEIPEVPDVAILNPEAYQVNLARLHQIETICA